MVLRCEGAAALQKRPGHIYRVCGLCLFLKLTLKEPRHTELTWLLLGPLVDTALIYIVLRGINFRYST